MILYFNMTMILNIKYVLYNKDLVKNKNGTNNKFDDLS